MVRLAMFAAVCVTLAVAASEPPGSIGGRVALMYTPKPAPADLAGCEVHVVSDRGAGKETRFPCGAWFVPGPAGAYKVWLEHGDTISDVPAIVRYAAEAFQGRAHHARQAMVPAGFVTLPADVMVDGAVTLRLFAPPADGGFAPFERRVPVADARAPRSVRMPAGSLLAGLYDARGNAVALAPPVQLEAGRLVSVAPERPSHGGAVLFSLQRTIAPDEPAAITLDGEPPDVLYDTPERVVAIWDSVHARSATLRFRGKGLPREPIDVSVAEGKITTVRETVREK